MYSGRSRATNSEEQSPVLHSTSHPTSLQLSEVSPQNENPVWVGCLLAPCQIKYFIHTRGEGAWEGLASYLAGPHLSCGWGGKEGKLENFVRLRKMIMLLVARNRPARTFISSSIRVTFNIGFTFCHSFHHGHVRSCRYFRRFRCTTWRAILQQCHRKHCPYLNHHYWTLAPGSSVLFQTLTIPQLIKIFPEFFENQKFLLEKLTFPQFIKVFPEFFEKQKFFFWEANSSSAHQNISKIVWNPKIH